MVEWNFDPQVRRQQDRQDYTGVGPQGYTRSDERIFEDVCYRLTQAGMIDASQMEVHVHDGVVTLSGTVDDRDQRRMAEDIAYDVSGVFDVDDQLKIQRSTRTGQEQGNVRRQSQQQTIPVTSGKSQGQQGSQSGNPGGGQGRVDEVGHSGVYPASGPWPEGDAPVQGEMSWGQGDRGEEGYYDSGGSEPHVDTGKK